MPRPREPYTFFVDRSLGRKKVAEPLRGAGEAVEIHDDHFGQDVEDVVWLGHAGDKG